MQVRIQEFAWPTATPLTIATAKIQGQETIVAAGFLPLQDLVERHQYDLVDTKLGALAESIIAWEKGSVHDFSLLVWQPGSPFQRLVWDVLSEIPMGATATYVELAASIRPSWRDTGCWDRMRPQQSRSLHALPPSRSSRRWGRKLRLGCCCEGRITGR
jgi:O6-methylguanine-DNA--protein-cysteine methyltransferase